MVVEAVTLPGFFVIRHIWGSPNLKMYAKNIQSQMKLILLILAFFIFLKAFSQSDSTYEIFALKFAERNNKISVSEAAVGSSGNDSLNVCFMYWLLKGNN